MVGWFCCSSSEISGDREIISQRISEVQKKRLTVLFSVLEKIEHGFAGQNTRVHRFGEVGVARHGTFVFAWVSKLSGNATALPRAGGFRRLEERCRTSTERCWAHEGFRRGNQQEKGTKRKVRNHLRVLLLLLLPDEWCSKRGCESKKSTVNEETLSVSPRSVSVWMVCGTRSSS